MCDSPKRLGWPALLVGDLPAEVSGECSTRPQRAGSKPAAPVARCGHSSERALYVAAGVVWSTDLADRLLRHVIDCAAVRGLGVRLHKPETKDWPRGEWAIVDSNDRKVVDSGRVAPPRSYTEPNALGHLHEAIARIVKENAVEKTFIWGIETNARLNTSMRPRLRAEGVACAAAALAGSQVQLGAWSEARKLSGTSQSKDTVAKATTVCGIAVDDADSLTVLAAIASMAI